MPMKVAKFPVKSKNNFTITLQTNNINIPSENQKD